MTIINIYPLWNLDFNFFNLAKYARINGFNVIKIDNNVIDKDSQNKVTDGGALYHTVTVSQTLISGQKTAIQDIFKGFAFVTFV